MSTSFLVRIVFAAATAILLSPLASARAQQPDFSEYHRAADYCRGDVARPMALSPDRRILCFDGTIGTEQNYAAVNELSDGGLFVVRSRGGDVFTAMDLADAVRNRHATVVVYDYCFSACASYLLMASTMAFVLSDTLVTWHYPKRSSWCPSLVWPKDEGPQRLEKSPCATASPEEKDGDKYRRSRNLKFYLGRAIDNRFDDPPESVSIRRILRHMFENGGAYPGVSWTWNPRHYPSALTVRIAYQAYPADQAEVDALAAKFLSGPVLYDP
jgi:hypothetical protein